jgi:hypothetical protein
MSRYRLQRFCFLTSLLLLLLAGGFSLWVRSQQRQYALNRRLITALTQGDDTQALALVNAGAAPNTHYHPPPAPSLLRLWKQLLQRKPPPTDDSPTAFLMASGAEWGEPVNLSEVESVWVILRTDNAALIQAMLAHGAHINARDKRRRTALHIAARFDHPDTVDVLLAHGADVNAQDDTGYTALCEGIYYHPNVRIIRQLLEHHADPNLLTNQGDNALSVAQHQENSHFIPLLLQYGARNKPPDPPTCVPAIAQILGVKVGSNGQEALKRMFGDGLHTIGGHPGGCINWYTHTPVGSISTDGFNYNDEGLALESLSWGLSATTDRSIPFVRLLPQNAGWLGVVTPGMTTEQVSQLTEGKLPTPQKQGNTWIWTAKGFVRPSPVNYDIYTDWTAQLTFQNGILDSIEIRCNGGLRAP